MTSLKKLTGSGTPPLAATQINGDVDMNATALGSTQATAYVLGACTTRFTTVAASTGAILPVGAPSDDYIVANIGANSLTVYPPVGGTLNGGSVNAGVAVAANAAVFCVCMDPAGLNWITK